MKVMRVVMGPPRSESKPRAVDDQFRVVVPAEVREALGLDRGSYVVFEVEGREVRLVKVSWSAEKGRR